MSVSRAATGSASHPCSNVKEEMLTLNDMMSVLSNTNWTALIQQIFHILCEFQIRVRLHQVIDHGHDNQRNWGTAEATTILHRAHWTHFD